MKELFVTDLAGRESQVVTSFFLVQSKELRSTKDGKPYLALRLADRSGWVEARMWDGVEEAEFDRDDAVKVEATVESYRGKTQLKVKRVRRAEESEVELEDLLAETTADVEALYAELVEIAGGVSNPHLKALLVDVLEDPELAPRLKQAPGAKTIHHAYRGGLLEHIVSLCRLCRLAAQNYPEVDLDLLLTGAILHDLGKVYELSYERSFDYTTEGNLLGHIAIALEQLSRRMDALKTPAELRVLVQHLLLSHHGRLEFGSPVTPRFSEAVLLHYLDDIDSKMEAIRSSLKAAEADGREGDWTEWNRALERPLLRKDRFTAPESGAPEAGQPAPAAPPTLFDKDKKK